MMIVDLQSKKSILRPYPSAITNHHSTIINQIASDG
jgi:hypothetical protein